MTNPHPREEKKRIKTHLVRVAMYVLVSGFTFQLVGFVDPEIVKQFENFLNLSNGFGDACAAVACTIRDTD